MLCMVSSALDFGEKGQNPGKAGHPVDSEKTENTPPGVQSPREDASKCPSACDLLPVQSAPTPELVEGGSPPEGGASGA